MKTFSIFLISLFTTFYSLAQSPVVWTFDFTEKGGNVIMTATAEIKNGWSIYGQDIGDVGPIPTQFFVDGQPVFFTEKSKPKKEFDPIFEAEIKKFKTKAVFTYTISGKSKNKTEGFVTFMTCDDEKCLPPTDVPFKYSW